MAEEKLISGEDLREELLEVEKNTKKYSLGGLVRATVTCVAYRNVNESLKNDNPNYQCVRDILVRTIDCLVKELDRREEMYLGLKRRTDI